jgi:hypothetical protein
MRRIGGCGVAALAVAVLSAPAVADVEALPEEARLEVGEEHITAILPEPTPHRI